MPKNSPFIFENFRAFGPKNFQVVLKWCQVGLPPTLFSRMTRNEKVKISPNWICTKILIDFFNFVYLAIFWELRHWQVKNQLGKLQQSKIRHGRAHQLLTLLNFALTNFCLLHFALPNFILLNFPLLQLDFITAQLAISYLGRVRHDEVR